MICRRFGSGPLLTRNNIPDMPPEIIDATSVFNPGAMMLDGVLYLLLRVQTRGRHTYLVPARGTLGEVGEINTISTAGMDGPVCEDGAEFTVAQRPTELMGRGILAAADLKIHHVYDPRITVIGEEVLVVTALDTDKGCRLGIWRATGDPDKGFAGLDSLMMVGLTGDQDTRNGVLFPEKIGGQYLMLHRPNRPQAEGGPKTGCDIVLSQSDNLVNWDQERPVMSGRPHFWDELIGSGPPPLKTEQGWLHLYHGIATHFQSVNIYQAGAVLLDLEDPSLVLGRTRDNLLEPREIWEQTGQVPNVVFPSGWVPSKMDAKGFAPSDSLISIFYGAADTTIGRADTTVAELIAACEPTDD
ncbi:MAG: hypothetical protein KOO60_14660 [Gemmatimonadales bacterium]|nr:hypothetical protein [Gemmatimonadales bacterium]